VVAVVVGMVPILIVGQVVVEAVVPMLVVDSSQVAAGACSRREVAGSAPVDRQVVVVVASSWAHHTCHTVGHRRAPVSCNRGNCTSVASYFLGFIIPLVPNNSQSKYSSSKEIFDLRSPLQNGY